MVACIITKLKNQYKLNGTNEKSTNYDIIWNNAFDLGKSTRIQLDGNFVGPSVTTQGRTDAFWYVNLALRQQLMNRKLSATLAFLRCLQFGPLCQQDHHFRPAIHHPDPSELSAYHVDVKLYI